MKWRENQLNFQCGKMNRKFFKRWKLLNFNRLKWKQNAKERSRKTDSNTKFQRRWSLTEISIQFNQQERTRNWSNDRPFSHADQKILKTIRIEIERCNSMRAFHFLLLLSFVLSQTRNAHTHTNKIMHFPVHFVCLRLDLSIFQTESKEVKKKVHWIECNQSANG